MLLTFVLKGQVVPNSMYRLLKNKRTGGTFIPNSRWERWRKDAGKQLLCYQRPQQPITDLCRLTLVFTHEDTTARDADNLMKSIFHLLTHMSIVKNDKQFVAGEWQTNLPPCRELAGVKIVLETL